MHPITRNEGNLVSVRAAGKLTQEDYGQLIPLWNCLNLLEAEHWVRAG
jgi:hypothetical protein